MVQLGDIRIKIVTDADFSLADRAEEIRNDVAQDLAHGRTELYGIMIQRAEPGEWDTIDSLRSSVHTAGLYGTYDSVTDIPDQQMRDTVTEMLTALTTNAN